MAGRPPQGQAMTGKELRAIRTSIGLSQAQLAESLQCARSTILRAEQKPAELISDRLRRSVEMLVQVMANQ